MKLHMFTNLKKNQKNKFENLDPDLVGRPHCTALKIKLPLRVPMLGTGLDQLHKILKSTLR